MRLYLLRHGETEEGKKNIILGQLPGNLTENGIKYAHRAGECIKNLPTNPDAIISSNLKRTKETAGIIHQITKIPLRFDALLGERSGGEAEGMPEEQIDWERYETETLEHRKHKNGESFVDVRMRVDEFLKKLPLDSENNIVIVSHSAVIAMMLSSVLGWDYKKALGFKFNDSFVILDTKAKEVEILPFSK